MLILRPAEDCLVAHTMFYANEVRRAPAVQLTAEFSNKDLSMALGLIKGYEVSSIRTSSRTCIRSAYTKSSRRKLISVTIRDPRP